MKKVLIIAHHLTIGGVQKSLVAALNAIDYEKNIVTLYVRKNRLDLLPLINTNVKVIINKDDTHYYRKPYAIWCQMLGILSKGRKEEQYKSKLTGYIRGKMMDAEMNRYLSGKHFDVAISYIQGYNADILERVEADKKYVFYHGSTDEAHEFHENLFGKIDGIVAVSKYVSDILKKLYPAYADKVSVIDNYVDADAVLKSSEKYEVDFPKNKIKLCSCGRLYPVKGFDLAVEAAKILKEKGVDFVWYFVGDGSERAKLERMISGYGLSDHIVITGMKDNPYPYMAGCDIFVQPSYEDAQPLSIIEAKILGIPVVATKTVGGCDQIQDGVNGVLAEINAESVAEGIYCLLTDKDKLDRIKTNLKNDDPKSEKKRYKENWEILLEG